MTLDKAIETMQLDMDQNVYLDTSDLNVAMKLGIEALKRLKNQRNVPTDISFVSLPGETKE